MNFRPVYISDGKQSVDMIKDFGFSVTCLGFYFLGPELADVRRTCKVSEGWSAVYSTESERQLA